MKTRFWDLGTRLDSNSFYRLWWIAELTATGDDYTLTEQVLLKLQRFCSVVPLEGLDREAIAGVLRGSVTAGE